jgi:ArsR family metal-binding transcriptional regulator
MLIEDYDLEVEVSPCRPGSEELLATVRLNVDITPVLPYLNRTLHGAAYNPSAPSLAWKMREQPVAFWPYKIAIGQLRSRTHAQAMARGLVGLVNRTWERRAEIEPDRERRHQPGPMVIYDLLPRTNCRACGQPTCFTFALRLVAGQARLEDCPPLQEPEHAVQRAQLADLLATDSPQERPVTIGVIPR